MAGLVEDEVAPCIVFPAAADMAVSLAAPSCFKREFLFPLLSPLRDLEEERRDRRPDPDKGRPLKGDDERPEKIFWINPRGVPGRIRGLSEWLVADWEAQPLRLDDEGVGVAEFCVNWAGSFHL